MAKGTCSKDEFGCADKIAGGTIETAKKKMRERLLKRGYKDMSAYTQSKLAQVMFTFELAEHLRGTRVTTNALHPATLMDTKMVIKTFSHALSSVQEDADATVRLAVSPKLEGITGRYFEGAREAHPNRQAYNAEARKRLWDLSEELCGRFLEPLSHRQ